jgi:hypothetical protein
MHELGQRAPAATAAKGGFSTAERLLLLSGLLSAVVLLVVGLGGL